MRVVAARLRQYVDERLFQFESEQALAQFDRARGVLQHLNRFDPRQVVEKPRATGLGLDQALLAMKEWAPVVI